MTQLETRWRLKARRLKVNGKPYPEDTPPAANHPPQPVSLALSYHSSLSPPTRMLSDAPAKPPYPRRGHHPLRPRPLHHHALQLVHPFMYRLTAHLTSDSHHLLTFPNGKGDVSNAVDEVTQPPLVGTLSGVQGAGVRGIRVSNATNQDRRVHRYRSPRHLLHPRCIRKNLTSRISCGTHW